MAKAPSMQECEAFAEKVGLRIVHRDDEKHRGAYVDVWIVYRLGVRQGKSRGPAGLLKLLKKTEPVKTQDAAAEAPPPAAAPARRHEPASVKQWWED